MSLFNCSDLLKIWFLSTDRAKLSKALKQHLKNAVCLKPWFLHQLMVTGTSSTSQLIYVPTWEHSAAFSTNVHRSSRFKVHLNFFSLMKDASVYLTINYCWHSEEVGKHGKQSSTFYVRKTGNKSKKCQYCPEQCLFASVFQQFSSDKVSLFDI